MVSVREEGGWLVLSLGWKKGIGKQGIGSVVRVAEREGWMGK
jgi:hypothetical protein